MSDILRIEVILVVCACVVGNNACMIEPVQEYGEDFLHDVSLTLCYVMRVCVTWRWYYYVHCCEFMSARLAVM